MYTHIQTHIIFSNNCKAMSAIGLKNIVSKLTFNFMKLNTKIHSRFVFE